MSTSLCAKRGNSSSNHKMLSHKFVSAVRCGNCAIGQHRYCWKNEQHPHFPCSCDHRIAVSIRGNTRQEES